MPELPEVEHFRRLLLPLCSKVEPLTLELLGENHNKKFLTSEHAKQLNKEKLVCQSIERRGKLICMVLSPIVKKSSKVKREGRNNKAPVRHLYVHMGMTGRITTPERVPCFGHVESKLEAPEEYPPRFSYLQFRAGSTASACFSDPRKFGYVSLVEDMREFESLSPDALTESESIADDAWCNYAACIKSVMLDQKKVVAGIGNWVADEMLWRAKLHPSQRYLKREESQRVNESMKYVLETAVSTSDTNSPYPLDWLFHVRWGKGKNTACKDAYGRKLTFIDVAGRTSAIAPSIQILSLKDRGPPDKKTDGKKKSISRSRKKADPMKSEPDHVKSEAIVIKVFADASATKRKGRLTITEATMKRIRKEVEVKAVSATKRKGRLPSAEATTKRIKKEEDKDVSGTKRKGRLPIAKATMMRIKEEGEDKNVTGTKKKGRLPIAEATMMRIKKEGEDKPTLRQRIPRKSKS